MYDWDAPPHSGNDPQAHYDVTGRVRVSDPVAVRDATIEILRHDFPKLDAAPLAHAFLTFTRLYAGELPGYLGCDTWYHDAQHSLDCALAMARLIDGHQRGAKPAQALSAQRAVLGMVIALFHDAGYIRRSEDRAANGAEYTLYHVRRSGDFLRAYLPQIGFGEDAEFAAQVVHFTGYEVALDRIEVVAPEDRLLGFMLGTADAQSQTADPCYLEKCRDHLYREFEICGLAGPPKPGGPKPIYRDAEDLLRKTPEFHRKLREERLDGYFGSVHRCFDAHFGGENLYETRIRAHLARIEALSRSNRLDRLGPRPEVIGAEAMRMALIDPRLSAPSPPAP